MKTPKFRKTFWLIFIVTWGFLASPLYAGGIKCTNGTTVDPFASNNGKIPPKKDYNGPLFQLSYNYPTQPPNPVLNPPWRQALNAQPLSTYNIPAYVNALKRYVSKDMNVLLYDYKNWDAAKAGWYNSPWVFGVREAIHGTFVGSPFPADTFPSLKKDMTTYVLTYYDKVAAYQLRQVWGKTAAKPNITETMGQFPEGSVIVKVAFTTASGKDWPPMKGAFPWKIYAPPDTGNGPSGAPVVQEVHLFQLDIIVKDSVSAPRTGWIFSTLVYDNRIKSGDNWSKMIPLGGMWGNDPTVVTPIKPPYPPLRENWINPKAPEYAKETLGWGDRLSGPNDGAVIEPAYVNGKMIKRLPASSCMSCHSSAEYPAKSFLLPVPLVKINKEWVPRMENGNLWPYTPASADWTSYFQSRYGTNGMDKGSFGLDYDMMLSFKASGVWSNCTKPQKSVSPLHKLPDNYRKLEFKSKSK